MNTKSIASEIFSMSENPSLEVVKQESPFYIPVSKIAINETFGDKFSESAEGGDISKRFFGYTDLHKNNPRWNVEIFYSPVEINYALTFDIRTEYLFNKEEIEQNLLEIRQETEEIYEIDNEIDRIDEGAYSDIRLLLNTINKTNPRIPMPDLDWADDGSLNTTWIHKDDIITMGVYGNNTVIFTLYFEEKRQMSGVCELSDKSILNGFLQTLDNILHE